MFKTLLDLGFRREDAEVYMFLTVNGSQNAKSIAEALNTYKRQVYRTLKRLQQNRIITATSHPSGEFSAVPFDKVLDLLLRDVVDEANRLEQKKEGIVALWKFNVKMQIDKS